MELRPFGPERDDQRAGVIASVIANVYRDTRRRPTPFGPDDFFPRAEVAIAPLEAGLPSNATLEQKLLQWAKDHNAAVAGQTYLTPR